MVDLEYQIFVYIIYMDLEKIDTDSPSGMPSYDKLPLGIRHRNL